MYTVALVYGSYTLEYNCHIPGHCCIRGYKLFDVIVQATYTIALLWFIELYPRGARLNHLASPRGLNTRLSRTIQINHSRL